MKQLIDFRPAFNPTAKTLDFSQLANFDISKLYAVINTTQNTPIYVPGNIMFGFSSISGSNILTLSFDTSAHSSSDILNIYYEVEDQTISLLSDIKECMNQILNETKITNYILAEGFSRTVNIRTSELDMFRDDLNKNNNSISMEN